MITYAPLQTTPQALEHYRALFAACFPASGKFSPAYLRWLYLDNPDGAAVGFDAWDGARLAGHYVCVPATARVAGAVAPVLLSLNTATHPDYQGRGLFTRLAEMTYLAAAAAGYAGVYGVANANSTPGFVRKLGFQLVRPLEARVGVGALAPAPAGAARAFERIWTPAALAWRCANPANPVAARRAGARWRFSAPAAGRWLAAYAELALGADGAAPTAAPGPLGPLRLFLGLRPDGAAALRGYASIPPRLRPSPLNLIYRPLSARPQALDPAAINFSFLDFDAY